MARDRPQALPARFDHFLEVVAQRSGHRLDITHLHLEVAFEQLSEALLGVRLIETRAFAKRIADLGHAARDATTPGALFSLYRRALEDLLELAQHPEVAARDHSLRRAEEHMRRHYAEKLKLEDVARVAGFAPDYFSKLFRRKQRITFERYLSTLRVRRAQQLLSGTSLNLERIAELTGFSCREYLGRTFRRITGETPIEYRTRSQRPARAATGGARSKPPRSPRQVFHSASPTKKRER
jgi:YesN/AraC family two-component response regulator